MFVTLQEVKQYLSISTPTEDSKITAILGMQNSFVGDYTGISPTPPDEQTVVISDYIPYPNNRMVIDEENIAQVTEVKINGVVTGVTASLMKGYMVIFSAQVSGAVDLTCEYKTNTTIPGIDSLRLAVMELTKFYLKQEYKMSVQSGGEAVHFDSNSYMPPHVKSILDLYRRS